MYIPCLLDHPKKIIKMKATWLLSNIAAGNERQLDAVIQSNVIPKVISLLEHSEHQTQRGALRFLANLSRNGNQKQVRYLLHQNTMLPLTNLTKCNNEELVGLSIGVIKRLCEHCTYKELEDLTLTIEESKVLKIINGLKLHLKAEMAKTLHDIIYSYSLPKDSVDTN